MTLQTRLRAIDFALYEKRPRPSRWGITLRQGSIAGMPVEIEFKPKGSPSRNGYDGDNTRDAQAQNTAPSSFAAFAQQPNAEDDSWQPKVTPL